jgi:uncharacterized protein
VSKSIVFSPLSATTTDLKPSPICADCVLAGKPEAKSKLLAKSRDGTSYVVAWECNSGRFKWHYIEDETLTIVAGEAFISTEPGEECRLGPGVTAFFPAGSSCEWRVPDRVRKVAVMRKSLGYPFGLGVRAWFKILAIVGIAGGCGHTTARVSSVLPT